MSRKRKCDPPGARTRFRTDRLHKDCGKWYFTTREGTLEGPFEDMLQAQERLDVYLSILKLELLEPDSKLAVFSE